MKAISFVKLLGLIVLGLFTGACTHNELDGEYQTEERPRNTCKMNLIGGVNGFDGNKSNAKAVSSTWQQGDKIYITFYNGTTLVPGVAVYEGDAGWTVSYDGNLAIGSNQKCEARFFVNATMANSYLVTLNPHTEIYEDVNGFYAYSNGELTVYASLEPKIGRIRFTGSSGSKINLLGITTYATYVPNINQFTTSPAMIADSVINGSTPYVYGYFTRADRSIGLIGDDFAFTRNCAEEVLKEGTSGYMAIPSEASHNNWRTGVYIMFGDEANEIQLKMMPVAGHTDGFFLMAETETTEQLWDIVNDVSSPSNSTYPKVYVNITFSGNIMPFIEKINNKTRLHFSLPTKDQWQYAAKGGDKSQGYTYAGSNIPEDVAWYAANTTSLQPVKTKSPNELGLYDMSGNASEWTSTTSGGSMNYYCGGNYCSSAANIKPSSCDYNYQPSHCIGFRLILTCP